MNSRNKYIGIESRVHFEVLEAAIADYIQDGFLDKEKCLSHIKQFTKGANRAIKILKHISVLVTKNENLLRKIKGALKDSSIYELSTSERKALILCLFSISYPITYDVLSALSQGFKVQELLNKQVIIQKIGAIYGGNRAMHIAVTELMPFLIECGIIQRVKLGIYSIESKLIVRNKFLAELIVYTDILLSGSKSILIDDLMHKAWYTYFDLSAVTPEHFKILVSKKDSSIGKGYLYLK
jgi:hypothetical protein